MMLLRNFVPILLVCILCEARALLMESHNGYIKQPANFSPDVKLDSGFHFAEVSQKLGINFKNNIPVGPAAGFISLNAGAYVADVNNDGYMDILFTSTAPKSPNRLYLNDAGVRFIDKTSDFLIDQDDNSVITTGAGFFDFNNDGYPDLLVLKAGGMHVLYKNDRGQKFVDVTKDYGLPNLNEYDMGVGFLDINRDGFLDFYISAGTTNHYEDVARRDKNHRPIGAKKRLFINQHGQSFVEASEDWGVDDPGATWTSSFFYLNNDLAPDIWIANTGENKLYTSTSAGKYTDATSATLGRQFSTGNMSVDMADINGDGKMDIFVSNVTYPNSYTHTKNFLYVSSPSGEYVDRSAEYGVDRCGFAWGAKFIDSTRSGELDLFVTNGFFDSGAKDYGYDLFVYDSLPRLVRYKEKNIPLNSGYQMGANDPKCFFLKSADRYVDVAEKVGFTEKYVGRGVARIDFSNSGHMDLIVSNQHGHPMFYKNEVKNDNHWVGLRLVGTSSNRDAIGAKITLVTAQKTQTQELFPTNGISSQSDPRIFFGVGKSDIRSITITWPSGHEQNVIGYNLDAYNEVIEN